MTKTILIVDDTKLNLRILIDILSREGYAVFACTNGLEALELASRINPDVILLDIVMPELDGFEVCKLLKEKDESKDIPIIMVTSETKSQNIKKALELGAFDYIRKPIDEVEVSARVNSALRFKTHQDKLKELAMKDGLTDLYNHRVLIELFVKEYEKQLKLKKGICFAMLDIDFYKKINDNFGHTSGDMVLREISSIIKSSVRCCDIVGRYGGEEFGIVFPDIELGEALRLCEMIRKNIEEYEFNVGNKSIRVTISIGICYKSAKEHIKYNEIIETADKALYKAKHSGRNKVEVGMHTAI